MKAFHLFKVAATKHSSGSGYANMGHMYLNGFVTDEIENMDSKRALSPTSSTANAKLNFYGDDYYISFERNRSMPRLRRCLQVLYKLEIHMDTQD